MGPARTKIPIIITLIKDEDSQNDEHVYTFLTFFFQILLLVIIINLF